jgi:hypothetical protein
MASSSNWLNEGEEEILAGFANKIGSFGGPGGQLVMTDQRLLFTNRRKAKVLWHCDLKDIVYAGAASNATIWTIALVVTLLIRNALKVTLKGGASQRFVVTDRAQWITLINERRSLKSEKRP